MSASKILSSSICFTKLVMFKLASLNPRLEGKMGEIKSSTDSHCTSQTSPFEWLIEELRNNHADLVCTAAATSRFVLVCRCDMSHEFKPV